MAVRESRRVQFPVEWNGCWLLLTIRFEGSSVGIHSAAFVKYPRTKVAEESKEEVKRIFAGEAWGA